MLQEGQQIGNHRIVRLLGRGGFADVYLGQHMNLGVERAIKLLRDHLPLLDREKFRREAHIIAALEHPHIVGIIDYDVWNDLPYIIMDYAPNGTMRQRHPSGSIVTPLTVLGYLRDIERGLMYAHQRRVVHCDIKPENILIGRHQDVLVSDFGIATILQSTASGALAAMNAEKQEAAGTVLYMSPEQLRAKPVTASDQYALAVMCYEWLCGRPPFQGGTYAIMHQHMYDKPSSIRTFKPDLPSALDDVLLTALDKLPEHRFPTVALFVAAFERAAQPARPQRRARANVWQMPIQQPEQTQPIRQLEEPARAHHIIPNEPLTDFFPDMKKYTATQQALPPIEPPTAKTGPVEQTRPRALSRRALIGALGAGALLAGAALYATNVIGPMLGGTGQKENTGQGTALAQGNKVMSTAPAILTTLHVYKGHTGIVNAVSWSPDGRYIVSGSNDKTVHVWEANTAKVVNIYKGHEDIVYAVSWSPDSNNIASGGADSAVHIWEVKAAKEDFRYEELRAIITSISWSSLGSRIACVGTNDEIDIFDAQNGNRAVPPYHNEANNSFAIAWSRDNTRLVSASGGGIGANVQIWDVLTGKRTAAYTGHAIGGVFSVAWSPDGKLIASGGADKTVHIWQPSTNEPILVYQDHEDAVNTVAWSPDGKSIASGSSDRTVRIWSATTGIIQHTYKEHRDRVRSLAWSLDGKRIVSASADATVHVWQAAR